MVNTSEASDFLNSSQVKNGQKFTIGPEDTHNLQTIRNPDGSQRKRLVIGLKETEVPLLLNTTSRRALEDAWGTDSAKWVGQKIKARVEKVQVGGQLRDALYMEPVTKEK